jgi:hypothetical protein
MTIFISFALLPPRLFFEYMLERRSIAKSFKSEIVFISRENEEFVEDDADEVIALIGKFKRRDVHYKTNKLIYKY